MRDRLAELRTLEGRIDALGCMLAACLPGPRALHPAVAHAPEQFVTASDVDRVVKDGGYSHRTLVSHFRRSVGLSPKRYCRVLRFQRALRQLTPAGSPSLASLAAAAGYSDQAHSRGSSGSSPV